MSATDYLVWGIGWHLIADWLLQNEWMALNKTRATHPAAWVHAGIHAACMLLVFPWPIAVVIGCTHLLIDLRWGLAWWRRFYRQTTKGAYAMPVAIWGDQVLHIAVLMLAAGLAAA